MATDHPKYGKLINNYCVSINYSVFLLSQLFLNYLSNYVPNQWTKSSGCVHCSDTISLLGDEKEWPKVFLALFVGNPTPFFYHVLEKIEKIDYPKSLITIWIHNQVCVIMLLINENDTSILQTPYHDKALTEWVKSITNDYRNVQFISSEVAMTEADGLKKAM